MHIYKFELNPQFLESGGKFILSRNTHAVEFRIGESLNSFFGVVAMAAALPKYETLELVQNKSLLTVIFNRPKRFNAFTGTMYEELGAVLRWADAASSVSVCMLTANGAYYSSGNDLGS